MLGLSDTFLLWTNLGISLLVLVLPGFFDLPLGKALLATLVGGLIGNTMLATAGLIGADARVPTMVLQRAPLGHRGSYLATGLNVLQCLGWAVFELIVIATAAGLLCDKLFGFRATWVWTLLFGAVTAALAFLGPIGFVRRYVRKVAIWAVAASLVYLTWWILDGSGGHHVWSSEGPPRLVLGGGRHRHRRHRLVGAARRRLHALLARPAERLLRRRARLSVPDAVPVRLRLAARPLARSSTRTSPS